MIAFVQWMAVAALLCYAAVAVAVVSRCRSVGGILFLTLLFLAGGGVLLQSAATVGAVFGGVLVLGVIIAVFRLIFWW